MQHLTEIIDRGFEKSGRMGDTAEQRQLEDAVEEAIQELDAGKARVAERIDGDWRVNQWLKKAVLLSFRLADNTVVPGTHLSLIHI